MTPDVSTVYVFQGKVRVFALTDGNLAPQAEAFESSGTAEFDIQIPPKAPVRVGDFLFFSGFLHRVATVDKFSTGARTGHAEVSVERREVPNFDIAAVGGSELISTGTYIGDGTNDKKIVTGLSGNLRKVNIWRAASPAKSDKTDLMTGKDFYLGPSTGLITTGSGIAFVGADFTVDFTGVGTALNASTETYFWVAFSTPA